MMKSLILIVSAIVIGLIVGYVMICIRNKESKKCFIVAIVVSLILFGLPLFLDKNSSVTSLPELSFNEDNGYSKNKVDTAKIDYVSSIVVENGDMPIDLSFKNDKNNKCNFIISIYLADGTKLYKSEKLSFGKKLIVSKFDNKLNKGVYNDAIICYDFIDENNNPTGRCEFTIEITSI